MPNEKSTRRVREFRARQRQEAEQKPGRPRGGYRQNAGRPRGGFRKETSRPLGGYRQNAGRPRGNRTAADRQRDYLQRKRERSLAMNSLKTENVTDDGNNYTPGEIEHYDDLQSHERDRQIFNINMAQTNLCRLCVTACSSPKSLYSANGVGNWVYQVTAKYFQTVFSNSDKIGTQLSNICEKCWCSIADYHTFELSIFGAQVELLQTVSSPAPENVCRLCVHSYDGDQYKRLFNNPANEVYRITFKYMHSMFSNPDGQNLGNICLKCWDHLQKFHKFQTDVYESQKMLPKHEENPHEVIVKMEEGIETPIVNQSCASQTTEEQVSINAKCYSTEPEFPIGDNDVKVKSEPIDLSDYETLEQPKLLTNETLNQSQILDHDETVLSVKSEVVSTTDQRSNEEIPSGFKDASCSRDSIVLPKLEIMDVPSEGDSNQANMLDENSDEEKEAEGQLNSKKGKAQTKRKGRSAPKYLDDLIAQWKPNLECIVCYGQFTSFTLLLEHFRRQHSESEFSIFCCQRKMVTRHSVAEHAKIHLDSEAYTCNICGKRLNSRSSYNSHTIRQHSNKSHDKKERNDKIETKRAPAKSYREFDDFLAQWRKSLVCEICGESVVEFSTLEQHFLREHPQVKCFITCCKKKLKYRSQISKHIVLHINPTAYKCEICRKCYCSNSSLIFHKKNVHSTTKDKQSTQDEVQGSHPTLNNDSQMTNNGNSISDDNTSFSN